MPQIHIEARKGSSGPTSVHEINNVNLQSMHQYCLKLCDANSTPQEDFSKEIEHNKGQSLNFLKKPSLPIFRPSKDYQERVRTHEVSILINKVLTDCCEFIHKIIPKSSSHDYVSLEKYFDESQNEKNSLLKINGYDGKRKYVKNDLVNSSGFQQVFSEFTHHTEVASQLQSLLNLNGSDAKGIESFIQMFTKMIKHNTGNCNDKATLLAIILEEMMRNKLFDSGMSKQQIDALNLKISVGGNARVGGNHAVVLISYKLRNEQVNLIADPWANGAVINSNDASTFYSSSFCNSKTAKFEEMQWYDNLTKDPKNRNVILKVIKDMYDIDFSSSVPLNTQLENSIADRNEKMFGAQRKEESSWRGAITSLNLDVEALVNTSKFVKDNN